MSIALHADTEKTIRAYAKQRGIEAPEAANKLVNTAVSRLAALSKYAAQQSKGLKAAKTKTKTKKASKKSKQ